MGGDSEFPDENQEFLRQPDLPLMKIIKKSLVRFRQVFELYLSQIVSVAGAKEFLRNFRMLASLGEIF